ncbi:hypothetical protein [Bradyrhizobium uaiense]|uniref:Uncharacterized protein n=1 Tax=Bradyrhizobium uaiense TaxID=2594946 RepID=A0A6P1BBI2_9BRAD|nr:hypothetical protein [Bradyrhizobium uaiense]NEU94832.1 hypothetical protein [Bradyrhizobium uaiense]
MPRPKSGPRLWLDQERETWTVIDGRKTVRTGCSKAQLQEAQDFLANYLKANRAKAVRFAEADLERVINAAKQAGAGAVVVKPDGTIRIELAAKLAPTAIKNPMD